MGWNYVHQDSGIIRLAEQHSKTDEPRDYPLIGAVADIIPRWKKKRLPACPFVFHRQGHPISYRIWRRAWQRAACQVGLGSFDENGEYHGVNLHDTRRAFVTDAVDSGIDPQTVKALSGHKTNAVFERYRILETDTLARDRAPRTVCRGSRRRAEDRGAGRP